MSATLGPLADSQLMSNAARKLWVQRWPYRCQAVPQDEGPWPARAGSSVQDAKLGPARLRQPIYTPSHGGYLGMRRKDADEEIGRLCPGDCCDAEPGCWDGGVWTWQGLRPGGNHECWALL